MLKSKKEIHEWLTSHKVENFTINDDLTVDVDGDVNLSCRELKSIPVKFGKTHHFGCFNNKLTSLDFAPLQAVNFICYHNILTSLKFAPRSVYFFDCRGNNLTSLEFAPQKVSTFYCSYNQLTSLEFAPQKVSTFYCSYNHLTSLEGLNIYSLQKLFCDDNLKDTDLYKKWKLYRTLS